MQMKKRLGQIEQENAKGIKTSEESNAHGILKV
jgi:hypothetical protein